LLLSAAAPRTSSAVGRYPLLRAARRPHDRQQQQTSSTSLPTKLVTTATSLEESTKNNFRSFIYAQRSTNPANFVKIGPVDVEVIGLREITENNSAPQIRPFG